MSDPSRPVAPFLPAEIVAKILLSVHPQNDSFKIQKCDYRIGDYKEFALLSRISQCWKVEGQRRLFETINIRSSKQLVNLVQAVEAGLGKLILSLTIQIYQAAFASPEDSHLIVTILRSVSNLKIFSLRHPQLPDLNEDDSNFMSVNLKLPHLIILHISPERDGEWSRLRLINEPIINAAPNLKGMLIENFSEYEGPPWTAELPALKRLVLDGPAMCVLKGEVFNVAKFKGLESLYIHSTDPLDFFLDFFHATGATIKELTTHSHSIVSPEIWNTLTSLESLEVSNSTVHDLSTLPPSITSFKIHFFWSSGWS